MMVFLFPSGVVTRHFMEARQRIANFVLEAFFSPSYVQQYVQQTTSSFLDPEKFGRYFVYIVLV